MTIKKLARGIGKVVMAPYRWWTQPVPEDAGMMDDYQPSGMYSGMKIDDKGTASSAKETESR